MSKYPYIPREYYAAVMFACKMIRENGYYNKAISTAANYYDVSEKMVDKYVRERQGAGQKGRKRGEYKYYVLKYFRDAMSVGGVANSDLMDEDEINKMMKYTIKKALSLKNAKKAIADHEDFYGNSEYSADFAWNRVVEAKEFETLSEAKEYVKMITIK